MTLAEASAKFERIHWSGDTSFTASCPAHEDRNPSLSVTAGRDGRLLFKCHGGCQTEDILSRSGLTWGDVLPEREARPQTHAPAARVWTIRDAAGNVVAEHHRIGDGSGKRLWWSRGGKTGLDGLAATDLPLYRVETLRENGKGAVVVCEGEKAADAAVKLKCHALATVCGACATPSASVLAPLRGKQVLLWPDADEAGLEHMQRIAKALEGVAASVRWIVVTSAKPKDDAADYRGTLEDLRRLVRDTPPGGPLVRFADRIQAADAELGRLEVGDWSRYVPTGIPTLDRALGGGGLRRGEVTLLAAPVGAGKTTLVCQFAMAAEKHGPVLIVSPEMSVDELVVREIVRRSGSPKWERATWAPDHVRETSAGKHARAISELVEHPPDVTCFEGVSPRLDDVMEQARKMAKAGKLSLIALDYAQQLSEDDPARPRYLAVGEVALRGIEMAREFDCAVLITSQVNMTKGKNGERDYIVRESAVLGQKVNNELLFVVDRDEKGRVEGAYFQARKVRDGGLFKLEVSADLARFSISDKPEPMRHAETREW